MDHELKQRLIGAVVVTALAAIFIPMLFDDPVDNRAKAVSELSVPPLPEQTKQPGTADKLPANKQQVLSQSEPGLAVSEVDEDDNKNSQSPASHDGDTATNANSAIDGQGLQSKIAGLPSVNAEKEPATEETVPPEEEPQQADEPVVRSERKAAEKSESKPNKSVSAKVEKDKAKETSKAKDGNEKKPHDKLVRWSLQAGSFSKKENAQAMVDKLRKQGLPASMVSKGNLYRIKIGPELDKAKAAEMKAKLASLKIQSYLQAE